MEKCEWCESDKTDSITDTVFWELPDGTRAIQIEDAPTVQCFDCGMIYQTSEITREIENQLFLIDTKKIDKVIKYSELMAQPKLLKRNYFDFSS